MTVLNMDNLIKNLELSWEEELFNGFYIDNFYLDDIEKEHYFDKLCKLGYEEEAIDTVLKEMGY